MVEKTYISWEKFHQDTKILAQKIQAYGTFDRIVAVSRGGLMPAGILAYLLDIRNCETINMSSYDDETYRSDEEIEISCHITNADEHTLIIDDLADSGRTFNLLRKIFPKAVFACVYAKPHGKESCDLNALDIPDNWVVFPWDI